MTPRSRLLIDALDSQLARLLHATKDPALGHRIIAAREVVVALREELQFAGTAVFVRAYSAGYDDAVKTYADDDEIPEPVPGTRPS